MKLLADHMKAAEMSEEQLADAAKLERKLVHAIVSGNYTAGPSDRKRIAEALAVPVEEIAWGHTVPVDHMWGHGPQFGRTP